ncbi:alpha/beta hydrolase [Dehalogenimonas etheniformans]|uniref:Serine aminopeptidase S33 domain-containing protein n=1 Tax=Dehalogenimonas etheniformans TaxID=1536648 RepID=A0A2P5P8Y3_9CHLR|nr:alpha/beta fold hydrolase [Dehalogenimonas etheniformans]PPD58758.1 hypothetical protein JP09_002480 [Dehalogenimonas etheniformans]QNT76471.1 alpha/beta fold hydrolase [Dehalogenimonas etheniformans]
MLLAILSIFIGLATLYFLVSALIANGMAASKRIFPPALEYPEVRFGNLFDDTKISGWLIPATGQSSKATLIAMHGGKQNRADETVGLLQMCRDVARLGFNVLSLDRRGCGRSGTARLNERTKSDRDFGGAIDWILKQNPDEKVLLFGTSFAGVAALVHASKDHRVIGVVADSSFKCSLAMAQRCLYETFPPFKVFAHGAVWMAGPVCGVGDDDAIDAVKKIICPVLFTGGELDRVVPPSDARELLEASGNPLDEILIVPGAGHSQAYRTSQATYIARLDAFINKCLQQ